MTEKEPYSHREILEAAGLLRQDGTRFWSSFDAVEFAEPLGEAWSPADNVRHLIRSTRPLTVALRMPRFVLRTLFGASTRGSRSYVELRERYRDVLARGGKAGRFAPSRAVAPLDRAQWQESLIRHWDQSIAGLVSAAAAWDEASLDRYVIPHPLLGKLTVREMLLFSIYHCQHHADNVVRRLGREPDHGNRTQSESALTS